MFGLTAVLPLTALIIGTSVLGAEIDDGSIVHLLATPVSRAVVIGAKYAGRRRAHHDLCCDPGTGGTTSSPPGVTQSSRWACSLAHWPTGDGCNAIFVMLSAVTTRAIAWGLLYVLIWEGVLGKPGRRGQAAVGRAVLAGDRELDRATTPA
mgnify:CR=1 FL=1